MSQTETKVINKQSETFNIIHKAVNEMVDTIKPTFGPASNKVIIDKPTYRMVVDDGVQIARDFELSDPLENAVVKVIRETAIKTNDRVGDGTTGALIMLQAIINEVARKNKVNGRKIEIELKKGLKDVKNYLNKISKIVKSKEDIKKVALISFDDEPVAEIIAKIYHKLGKDGTITIGKSPTMETFSEMTDGIKINSGYISPYMITDPSRMESIIEKPNILITDYRMTETNDILKIMEKMVSANKRELVVICENMEQSALATSVANKIEGKFLVVAIVAPSGSDRKIVLEDISLMTGAKMFTESKGDKLENVELKDLGKAERFICRGDESIILGPKGNKINIATVISSIRMVINNEKNEALRLNSEKRLNLFTNSMAVIKVGASTESEQKALKYKVEDAVNSVKVSLKNGVVCGAGLALSNIKTSSSILNEALKYPSRQLHENMGLSDEIDIKNDYVMNVVTGKKGSFMEVGVVDPVDVLLAGVESAVSIASLLVTSSGMIVEHTKNE